MLLRRCAVLYIEPREDLDIDWSALFSGDGALGASMRWVALAPHLDREIDVDGAELAALGGLGQTLWIERSAAEERYGSDAVAHLLDLGLLIGDAPELANLRERD